MREAENDKWRKGIYGAVIKSDDTVTKNDDTDIRSDDRGRPVENYFPVAALNSV